MQRVFHSSILSSTIFIIGVSLNIYALFALVVDINNEFDPYMDEIFHIPQAREFCLGNFHHWNPKITTYPGLYLFAYISHKASSLFGKKVVCDQRFLRIINYFISLFIPVLSYQILQLKSNNSSVDQRKYNSIITQIIWSYPFSFLYYYLFYTDTISLFSILLTYWLNLLLTKNSRRCSKDLGLFDYFMNILLFLSGIFSIFCRQTNAIWLLYLFGINTVSNYKSAKGLQNKSQRESDLMEVSDFVRFLIIKSLSLFASNWALLVPVLGFIVFVLKSGSIVLGDKDNHQPGLHFAMLSHQFFLIGLFLLPSYLVDSINYFQLGKSKLSLKRIVSYIWPKSLWLFSTIVVLSTLCLVFGSKSHPFLLADNRHYVFYIWNRFLKKLSFRVFFSPIYSCVIYLAVLRLYKSNGILWFLVFLAATSITLVPTPLLEPRYFTPGVVVALLNLQTDSIHSSRPNEYFGFLITLGAFIILNSIVIYVYKFKPFLWTDGSFVRFMY